MFGSQVSHLLPDIVVSMLITLTLAVGTTVVVVEFISRNRRK